MSEPDEAGRRPRVCAAVVSHLPYDARVWRAARSLAADGYRVELMGLRYGIHKPRRRSESGVDVLELPFGERHGSNGFWGRTKVLARLWLRILGARAEIFHCHNVHVAPPVLVAAARNRAAVIYDAHELFGEIKPGASLASRISARLTRLVEAAVVARAHRVITTNPARAEVLRERYPHSEVVVVGNVTPLVENPVPLDPGFPAGVPVLLYQGGIYARARAFETTIKALSLLPAVHFAIVGFGREEDLGLLRDWAEREGVADRLHIYPPRRFDELVSVAAAATVGIVPLRNVSQNSHLGDTNKLFEYMMAGLPAVGSDFPEVARVLGSGDPRPGETFDPEDPHSIAAAVERVLDDRYPERRRSARQLAISRFNWSREEPALLACFLGAGRGHG